MSERIDNRRKHVRLPINLRAQVAILLPEESFSPKKQTATLTDLSRGGACLEVVGIAEDDYKQLLREVRYAKISVMFPGVNHETELHGKLVWTRFDNTASLTKCSYGIMFEKITPQAKADVEAALNARRMA